MLVSKSPMPLLRALQIADYSEDSCPQENQHGRVRRSLSAMQVQFQKVVLLSK